jgi:uncharacterized Zn-binding protein involved in type VI secretion
MGKPAARIGDMHVCPMVTPGTPPVPHVGGPITGPGCPTVLIGGMPAAVMGDICTCVGPPATVVLGSTGVFFGGKPAARMGDQTAHGGTISVGFPTVMIGEMSPGAGSGMGGAAGGGSAGSGVAGAAGGQTYKKASREALSNAPPQDSLKAAQVACFLQAAEEGTPYFHCCDKCAKASLSR